MAYTTKNFKSKKALVDALRKGETITCFNPGLGGDLSNHTGNVSIEGPHAPEPHKWYGTASLENGVVKKVR